MSVTADPPIARPNQPPIFAEKKHFFDCYNRKIT